MRFLKQTKGIWLLPPALWFALLLTLSVFAFLNPALSHFDLPSVASFDEVHIGSRVKQYYISLLFFLTAFIILVWGFSWYIKKFIRAYYYFKLASKLSAWGLLSMFSLLQGGSLTPLHHLFSVFTLVLLLMGVLAHYRAFPNRTSSIDLLSAVWGSFSLVVCLRFWGALPGLTSSLFVTLLAITCLGLLTLLIKSKSFRWKPVLTYFKVIYYIPFLVFIAFEFHYSLPQIGVGTWLILGILAVILLHIRKKDGRYYLQKAALFTPMILGLSIAQQFMAQWVYNGELFETANLTNAVHRFFEYGEWPIVSYFSSHVVSDWFWPFLYTLVNGFEEGNMAFFTWLNYQHVVQSLVIFWLFRLLTKSHLWAFGLLLIFPFEALIPFRYVLTLVGPLLFVQLLHRPLLWRMLLFVGWSIFVLFWSMELGLSHSLAMLGLWGMAFLIKSNRFVLWRLLKVLLIQLLVLIFVYQLACYYKDINPLFPIQQVLHYAGAAQAHGFAEVALQIDRYFMFHYVLFPAVALFALLFFVRKRKTLGAKQPYLYMVGLFTFLFYIANFQRGLIRHSLLAGYDHVTDSLFYLGLLILFLLLFKRFKTNKFFRFQGAVILLATLMFFTKYGTLVAQQDMVSNLLKSGLQKVQNAHKLPLQRAVNEAQNYPHKLVYLLKHKLASNATFFDFSNNPGLYYATNRKVPGYFNQPLQNSPTAAAQLALCEAIKNHETPLVVFEKTPLAWGDEIDGVPNPIRYPIVAQFINDHYEAWATVDGFVLYKQKNTSLDLWTPHIKPIESASANWQLKSFPALLSNIKKQDKLSDLLLLDAITFKADSSTKDLAGDFVAKVFAQNKPLVELRFRSRWELSDGKYVLPINLHPSVQNNTIDSISIKHELQESSTIIKLK